MHAFRISLAGLLALALGANAQDHAHGPAAEPAPSSGSAVGALSPELRDLLRREMLELQVTMSLLIPAIAAGDRDSVGELGGRVRDGFVLGQELSDAQRRELREKLPADFLERDEAFHRLAGGLVVAAAEKRDELLPFYVAELTRGCFDCHARYAAESFPGFAPSHQQEAAHHH